MSIPAAFDSSASQHDAADSPAIGIGSAPGETFPANWSLADLLAHLGNVAPNRVRFSPFPGTATEADVVRLAESKTALCELVDGVLVEKSMGYYESRVTAILLHWIQAFLDQHDLGFVLAPDAPLRVSPNQVRMPDISFIEWRHFPDRILPATAALPVAPDLAIEVLSPSNTAAEMERKLRDLFASGTRLVWMIDPDLQSATVHRPNVEVKVVHANDRLDGGDVLPGFSFVLHDLFVKAGGRSR